MAHAHNILRALAGHKCEVCGWNIGKEDAGSTVHAKCVERQYMDEQARVPAEPVGEHETRA